MQCLFEREFEILFQYGYQFKEDYNCVWVDDVDVLLYEVLELSYEGSFLFKIILGICYFKWMFVYIDIGNEIVFFKVKKGIV